MLLLDELPLTLLLCTLLDELELLPELVPLLRVEVLLLTVPTRKLLLLLLELALLFKFVLLPLSMRVSETT